VTTIGNFFIVFSLFLLSFPVNEWMKNFENKIKTLTEHHDSLPDEEVVRLGKKDPEAYPLYIDKFIHIQWGGRDRMVVVIYNYLCNQCLSPLML